MKIRRLTLQEIRKVYNDHVIFDFPDDERKPLDMIEKLLAENIYQCFGAFEIDICIGYAFFALDGDIYLLDYFAVIPEWRDKGIGTLFLKDVVSQIKAKILILEIEDFKEFSSSSDVEKCIKRQAFYSQAGCVETHVKTKCFGVTYLILEYPIISAHDKQDITNAYKRIYQTLLPKLIYEENIEIQ